MITLCICYDLNSPGQDYKDLIDKIKSLGMWWHYLDSTWMVNTSRTPVEVRNLLMPFLDSNDELLVFKVGSLWTGYGFDQKAYEWLQMNWQSG